MLQKKPTVILQVNTVQLCRCSLMYAFLCLTHSFLHFLKSIFVLYKLRPIDTVSASSVYDKKLQLKFKSSRSKSKGQSRRGQQLRSKSLGSNFASKADPLLVFIC